MKVIIENGKVNDGIQNCTISGCGVEITFHNNDLADKFVPSLDLSGVEYVKGQNKVIILCLGKVVIE